MEKVQTVVKERAVGVCLTHPTEKASQSANGFIDCEACWWDKNSHKER